MWNLSRKPIFLKSFSLDYCAPDKRGFWFMNSNLSKDDVNATALVYREPVLHNDRPIVTASTSAYTHEVRSNAA